MSDRVFNRASNRPDVTTISQGRDLAIRFVQTLAELDVQFPGEPRALRLPQSPWELVFSDRDDEAPRSLGQYASEFYGSPETYDLGVFFDAMQSYAPAVAALEDEIVEAILEARLTGAAPGFDAEYEAIHAAGFEAMQCALTNSVLVSLDRAPWQFSRAAFLRDDVGAELRHASRPEHVADLVRDARRSAQVRMSRQSFMAERGTAFPCLDWGRDVEAQMAKFSSAYAPLAFGRLTMLDDIVRDWRARGLANPDTRSLVFKPESQLTMDNYGGERLHRSADGSMRTYETHIWIDGGHRIHFVTDPETRSLEIGYIGPHLRTWKH